MTASSKGGRALRVCLVIDNPLRDLEGIVLVSRHLARRGVETYLVPMYDQGTAVLGLEPDAVVVNYARATNCALLQTYAGAGIMVSVLDTEGGIVDSLEEYATSVARNGTVSYIDQMLMWGPLQHGAFVRFSGLRPDQLELTGCPRMDFCSDPWRGTLSKPANVPTAFVLVNTNFSLVNPRFSASLGKELATTLHAGFSGWDSAYIERLAKETQAAMNRFVAYVADLARSMRSLHFVVRPHPFENPDTYNRAFAGIPNIQVRLEGAVMSWIHASSAVLHLNCGSAVEAALMNKTAINLDWLNTDALVHNAPFPREISQLAESPDVVRALLERVAEGGELETPASSQAQALSRVREWFHNGDGRAAERAADAIVGALERRRPAAHARIRARALIGAQPHRPVHGVVDVIGKALFGGAYRWFRNEIASGSVARGTRATKAVLLADVQSIVARLSPLGNFTPVTRSVRWSETWIPGQAATSVALLPSSASTSQ